MLGSVDKRVWQILDTELKVNLRDPYVTADMVLTLIAEFEATITKYLDS